MARRPRERKGGALASKHCSKPRERRLNAPVACLPGAGPDRSRGVEAMLTEPGVDPREIERTPPNDRECVGKDFAVAPGGNPLRISFAKEVEIFAAVYPKQGFD